MTIPTVPEHDPQARVRELLARITVTNLETGKPLTEMGKRGRVFAAVRGSASELVRIDWGTTSPVEVRAALDALRGQQEPLVRRLTPARAQRIVDRCLTPMRASRASERVYRLGRLAEGRGDQGLASDYLTLSTALNERRHAILQSWLPGGTSRPEYAEHCDEARYLIGRLPSEVAT